ncbi:hypothetical protein [Legionella drozanskii]|uniref:MFS transporter n=1 Tax=Legionella drozanskii LLAP-1 TaxID=1212489 RepID=A0A0W0SMZ4_9GAMM|nr:hypothetical protein [Legionella drozanskii]KTC84770.1 hypothetical protein Ldro_2934 [Legionella drozanskii LLAP-1]
MSFYIRFVTATCLFALLGKANIWLSPLSNIILAIGYRFFLLLSPLFNQVSKNYTVSVCLMLSALGICLLCSSNESILVLGAILVGVGLSVSGYVIKAKASETPSGAAYNKIALNFGSLAAGLILLLTLNSKQIFFGVCVLILTLTAIAAFILARKQPKKEIRVSLITPRVFSFRHFIAWLLLGIAVGIKLFGVFSILPQYLIYKTGYLPSWYGMVVLLNSVTVIFFQLPIIHWVEKQNINNNSFKIVIFVMILGMCIISSPSFFYAEYLTGSICWILLLSFVECFASYLDLQGAKSQFLLVKETSVGLGAGLTVLLSRELSYPIGGICIGLLGFIVILIAVGLLSKVQHAGSIND